MADVKCPNPACGWTGNAPEWEFCGHCGAVLRNSDVTAPDIKNPALGKPERSYQNTEKAAGSSNKHTQKTEGFIKPRLVVIQNGRIGHEFELKGISIYIGRWDPDVGSFPEIDLTEDDSDMYVSRRHARILIKNNHFFIEDLDSTNKTLVNKRIKLVANIPHELRNGDEITIGKTVLKLIVG